MKTSRACVVALAALSISAAAVWAQGKTGVDKLYILNCGEGVAGDISRWSPGVNVGKPMDFVDNCYLMHHAQGWLLWDTGVTDAIAAMPEGQAPADPRMTHWRRPKTLAAQLDKLGVKPGDIKYRDLAYPSRPHRQCGAVSAGHAARPEGRIRVAGPVGAGASNPSNRLRSLKAITTSSPTAA